MIYFPVSGVETSPLLPAFVAFLISSLTSMGGVSGAFLILPFQMSVLRFTSPAVTPTNLVYNIIGIPSGVYRYLKEGRLLWPLTWILIFGTLPGIFLGMMIRIKYLPESKDFKLFVGLVLLYLGGRLLCHAGPGLRKSPESTLKKKPQKRSPQRRTPSDSPLRHAKVSIVAVSASRITYRFGSETHGFNPLLISSLSLAVGVISGAYGTGGGAIIAPLLVAIFKLPVHTIAGSTLTATFLTSVSGVSFYSLIGPAYASPGMAVAPDWALGAMFGIGGLVGMYCGARLQKFVPERIIQLLLGGGILLLSMRYILQFFS